MKDRKNSGFTQLEMLIVVGIVVILMAVAFVGVLNYRRGMKRLELDEAAKEIFIAAQNHLTMTKTQGSLDTYNFTSTEEANNAKVGYFSERKNSEGKTTTYRCFFVAPGVSPTSGNVLYDMLPRFSLDDTVRQGGSYVIEYDPVSATITNVFYSDQSDLSKVTFTSADYNRLIPTTESGQISTRQGFWGTEQENPGAPGRRLDGFRESDSNTIIGWYGGDSVKALTRTKLYAPTVEIINEECLLVRVSFPTQALSDMTESGINAILQLTITGKTSGKTRLVNVSASTLGINGESLASYKTKATELVPSATGAAKSVYCGYYVLDDITQKDMQFAKQWCEGDESLIPGEIISVEAEVSSNSVLANIASSVSQEESSLFGKKPETITESPITPTAYISNIRHLENLDAAVSGLDKSCLSNTGDSFSFTAVQTSDLLWLGDHSATSTAFTDKIFNNKGREAYASRESSADKVRIFKLDGSSSDATSEGTYRPVVPQFLRKRDESGSVTELKSYSLTYNGGNNSISTVKVNASGSAGIFATLTSGSSVSNLELIDCNIQSTGGTGNTSYAGTLAGEVIGKVNITNVLARNSSGSATSKVIGVDVAGGLIGKATSGASSGDVATIDSCAAAVIVKATGNTSSVAGGFIGSADGAKIKHSYAAAHTKDGKYEEDTLNVTSASSAGGLIGSSNNADVQYCYSTCSVSSQTAGGLVGNATNGSVSDCYCTGLIKGAESKTGAFAGTVSGTNLGTSNYYYAIVNGELNPVGSDESNTSVVAFDQSTAVYQAYFSNVTSQDALADAVPYDETLSTYYHGKYPFKSIKLLDSGFAAGDSVYVSKHYGDWPMYETFVINTKSQS